MILSELAVSRAHGSFDLMDPELKTNLSLVGSRHSVRPWELDVYMRTSLIGMCVHKGTAM